MFDAALCQTIHGQPLEPLFWPRVSPLPANPLCRFWRRFRWQLGATWLLFAAENLCRLAQPLALALALDGLLQGAAENLLGLVLVQLAYVALGAIRRMYDTRTFARAQAALAGELVTRQAAQGAAVTQLAARTALLRELLDFVERDLPLAVQTGFTLAGVTLALGWSQPALAAGCLTLLALSWAASRRAGPRVRQLSRALHDRAEDTVGVIERNAPARSAEHFRALADLQIRLSDWQAWGFGLSEALAAGLLAFSVWLLARDPQTSPGDLLGNVRYVLLFSASACSAPLLLQQAERLRDIWRRVAEDLG